MPYETISTANKLYSEVTLISMYILLVNAIGAHCLCGGITFTTIKPALVKFVNAIGAHCLCGGITSTTIKPALVKFMGKTIVHSHPDHGES